MTYFCDFPIALIPVTMSCSQATAKLSGQNPASMGALKCTQHILSQGGSVENGKQDVKDPENAREGVTMRPAHTGHNCGDSTRSTVVVRTKKTPVPGLAVLATIVPASAIIRPEPRLVSSGL